MYWIAICPRCNVEHELCSDKQPPSMLCWHPICTKAEADREAGYLSWMPYGMNAPDDGFTVKHPSPSLGEWPETKRNVCEFTGCNSLALRSLPVCRVHAGLVAFQYLQDVALALDQPMKRGSDRPGPSGYGRAYWFLMNQLKLAVEIIDG